MFTMKHAKHATTFGTSGGSRLFQSTRKQMLLGDAMGHQGKGATGEDETMQRVENMRAKHGKTRTARGATLA